jgi:hypothetical protein
MRRSAGFLAAPALPLVAAIGLELLALHIQVLILPCETRAYPTFILPMSHFSSVGARYEMMI